MMLTVPMAAEILEVSKSSLYVSAKYNHLVVNTDDGNRVDEKVLYAFMEKKEEERLFCIDMTMFADWLIGRDQKAFYEKFTYSERKNMRDLLERSGMLTSLYAKRVEEAHKNEHWDEFQAHLETDETQSGFVPYDKRDPLTFAFISSEYWNKKKTMAQIAIDLNVPKHWVYKEIRRLGMGKKECGIKLRGRKGYVMPEDEKAKHQKQPHAKRVVRICPKSFVVLREYRSTCSVEEDGYRRENVRKAIKHVGLHKGFLWAHKGMEEMVISLAKKRGNLSKKLKQLKVQAPSRERMKSLYVDQNLPAEDIASILGCSKHTVAQYAMKMGLKRRTPKIPLDELRRLYIDEGLSAKEIAKKFGKKASSVSTWLSKNGIKRRSA